MTTLSRFWRPTAGRLFDDGALEFKTLCHRLCGVQGAQRGPVDDLMSAARASGDDENYSTILGNSDSGAPYKVVARGGDTTDNRLPSGDAMTTRQSPIVSLDAPASFRWSEMP